MTKNFDENMDEFFELDPEDSKEIEYIPQKTIGDTKNFETDFIVDYAKARDNFEELLAKGKEALDVILEIARESEQPRSFEVAATLLNNLVAANEKMIALHRQVREISNYKASSENLKTTVNNTLFVGSTADLSRMLKDLKEKEILEDET